MVTGHTGFKGSWLSLILNYFGATILGVSDSVPTNPSHFKIYKNLKKFESKKVDISNKDKIKKCGLNFSIFKFVNFFLKKNRNGF